MINNQMKLLGEITIFKDDKLIYENKCNIVTYSLTIIDMLLSETDNEFNSDRIRIHQFAVGDGLTPALQSDTALENQLYIKDITKKELSGNGTLTTGLLQPNEFTGQINEIGFFSKDNELLNRINVDIFKTSLESLTIYWQHTLIVT